MRLIDEQIQPFDWLLSQPQRNPGRRTLTQARRVAFSVPGPTATGLRSWGGSKSHPALIQSGQCCPDSALHARHVAAMWARPILADAPRATVPLPGIHSFVKYDDADWRTQYPQQILQTNKKPAELAGFSVESLVALPGIEPGF